MSSLGMESFSAVGRDALEEWLKMVVERLGKDLIRMKGVLKSSESGSLVVQGVGGHIDVSEVDRNSSSSRLVIIGRVADELRSELQESFQALAKL